MAAVNHETIGDTQTKQSNENRKKIAESCSSSRICHFELLLVESSKQDTHARICFGEEGANS